MPGSLNLLAVNTAPDSENRIHSDAGARSLGFRSGLVPGSELHGYLEIIPRRQWGISWLSHGSIWARFLRPVFDGDPVRIEFEESGTKLQLELRDAEGRLCAAGEAEARAGRPPPPVGGLAEVEPAGARRPPDLAVGGSVGATTEQTVTGGGRLIRLANQLLMASYVMPYWIHVESRTWHLEPPPDRPLQASGRITAVYEKRGHGFVELDVLIADGRRPVAIIHHVAIHRPGGLTGGAADSGPG